MSEPVGGSDGRRAEPAKRTGRGGRRAGAGRPRRSDADEKILDTTLELLEQRGYGNLRVDDVAAGTGIAKSTIYRRWPSKSALVAASVQRLYLDRVTVPDTGSLRRDLTALLTNSYQLLTAGPGRIFEGLIRESGQRPELVDVVTQTMHARRRFYSHVFNRAIARGEIPPETDTGLAIDLLLGPLWVRLLVTREPIHLHNIHTTVHAVLDGLLPPTSRPDPDHSGTERQP
jgi:AcrR family transcriptional regulator